MMVMMASLPSLVNHNCEFNNILSWAAKDLGSFDVFLFSINEDSILF